MFPSSSARVPKTAFITFSLPNFAWAALTLEFIEKARSGPEFPLFFILFSFTRFYTIIPNFFHKTWFLLGKLGKNLKKKEIL